MRISSKGHSPNKELAPQIATPVSAVSSVLAPPTSTSGERRTRSRNADPERLFDDAAATTFRAQLAALVSDLDRSRAAETLVTQRATLLAASLDEMQRGLEFLAPTPTPAQQVRPHAVAADAPQPTPAALGADNSSALRAQLASLVAELEGSRLAEAVATRQAELLAGSLENMRRTLEVVAPAQNHSKRRLGRWRAHK